MKEEIKSLRRLENFKIAYCQKKFPQEKNMTLVFQVKRFISLNSLRRKTHATYLPTP